MKLLIRVRVNLRYKKARAMRQDDNDQSFAVLIVEDEVILRMDAVDMIEDAGFATVEAGTAAEALHMLETRPSIRVLFTDVDMPGATDGRALALQVSRRWPDVATIVTSGHIKVGCDELPPGGVFLAKPYAPRDVVRALTLCAERAVHPA